MGVTDLFLKTITSIENIEFFNMDEEIIQGNTCAHAITDDQMVHQIMSPITGRIVKINNDLKVDINTIVKDPYFNGWLYTIIPSDLEYEIKRLTDNLMESK